MNKKRIIFLSSILVLVLICIITFILLSFKSKANEQTHISIDTAISVELYISNDGNVAGFIPLNDVGEDFFKSVNISGVNIKDALTQILTKEFEYGYLSKVKNTVLLSFDKSYIDKNIVNSLPLIIEDIQSSLNIMPCVVTHNVTVSDSVSSISSAYDISFGKARFINRIINQDIRYSIDDLANLSANELNIVSVSGDLMLENVSVIGSCNKSGFITKEDAIKESVANAKIWESDINNLKCSLIIEDGKLVYNVLFEYNNLLYEYDIDAKSGALFYFEKNTDVNILNENNHIEYKNDPEVLSEEKYELMLIPANHADIDFTHMTDFAYDTDVYDSATAYKITFNCDGYFYTYYLDINTKEILYFDKKMKNVDSSVNELTINKNENGFIGSLNAALISISHAGVSSNDLVNYMCTLCKQRGYVYYEINFQASGFIFNYMVDAGSGKVIKYEKYKF